MLSVDPHELAARLPTAVPFVLVASIALVGGGLISAAAAFSPSYHASWAVAYLVLVVGVSQLVLGLGQAILAPRPPTRRTVTLEWSAYNLGNAGVLLGTLVARPLLTVTGSVLLAVALVLLYSQAIGTDRSGWPLHIYRALLAILFISIPVGLLIARSI